VGKYPCVASQSNGPIERAYAVGSPAATIVASMATVRVRRD
jgi:hypothetical protein